MTQLDIASQIKDSVSALEFGRDIGLTPNMHGFCLCPFHADQHASMKLYSGRRGYYCFTCHAHGDVIDLAQHKYGCSFRDAMIKLNDLYRLGIDFKGHTSDSDMAAIKARQEQQRIAREVQKAVSALLMVLYWDTNDAVSELQETIKWNAPKQFDEEWSEDFCQALIDMDRKQQTADIWTDEFLKSRWETHEAS